MAIDILMPALSPTMEEGTLAKWLVKEGDTVASGDILAEIETDKATMEFEAVDEGIVGRLLIAEGTEAVRVNTPIAILVDEGEAVPGGGRSSRRRGHRGGSPRGLRGGRPPPTRGPAFGTTCARVRPPRHRRLTSLLIGQTARNWSNRPFARPFATPWQKR